jgi:hypothetical protein
LLGRLLRGIATVETLPPLTPTRVASDQAKV